MVYKCFVNYIIIFKVFYLQIINSITFAKTSQSALNKQQLRYKCKLNLDAFA